MITKIISWLFGVAVFVDGALNLFYGNDFGLGVFFVFLSFIYFPPTNVIFQKRFGISIPNILKIILGMGIIWVTLAVGALAEGYII